MSGRYAYNTGMNEYGRNGPHGPVSEELSGVPKSFDFIPKATTPCQHLLSIC